VTHYGLTQVFSPVIIYPFWTAQNQSLEVTVVSDRWEDVTGTAQLTWFDWQGNEINKTIVEFITPSLNNSVLLGATGLQNILPTGTNESDVWLRMNLTAETASGTVTNEQVFNPVSLAQANLVDPKILVTATENMTFTLAALGGVGVFTWIDHPADTIGYFVDTSTGRPSNGFNLIPGQNRTLAFVMNADLSVNTNADISNFVVRSLWNNTHI